MAWGRAMGPAISTCPYMHLKSGGAWGLPTGRPLVPGGLLVPPLCAEQPMPGKARPAHARPAKPGQDRCYLRAC